MINVQPGRVEGLARVLCLEAEEFLFEQIDIAMKKMLVTLVLACMALCSYAQRDIPAGSSMDVASVENNDNHFTLYKIKDNDGNPGFYLSAGHVMASVSFESLGSSTTFSLPEGSLLYFGATSEEAMDNLDSLLDLFAEQDGAQKEFTCRDGSAVTCTLHKGFLGKYLSIGETSITKSDVKSLKGSFKISLKLHPDL